MISKQTLEHISDQINEDQIFKNEGRRSEMIKIMIQTMQSLGLNKSADILQQESKVRLNSQILERFKHSILQADWVTALDALKQTEIELDSYQNAQQLITVHKYLELIEQRRTEDALKVLREEISQFPFNSDSIYRLSSLLICRNPEEMKHKLAMNTTNSHRFTKYSLQNQQSQVSLSSSAAPSSTSAGAAQPINGTNLTNPLQLNTSSFSRTELLETIQSTCEIPGMLRPHLMQKLIKDSLIYQAIVCPNHHHQDPMQSNHRLKLFEDHVCGQLSPPIELVVSLREHKLPVILIRFNDEGTKLVSVAQEGNSKDVIVWEFDATSIPHPRVNVLHRLSERQKLALQSEITCVEFDRFGTSVAIGLEDGSISVFNLTKFVITASIANAQHQQQHSLHQSLGMIHSHSAPVLTLAFRPTDNSLYSSGADSYMLVHSNAGKQFSKKIACEKTRQMQFIKHGSQLVMVCAGKPIVNILDIATESIIWTITESKRILSMNVSSDECFLLLTTSDMAAMSTYLAEAEWRTLGCNQEVNLWDIEKREKQESFKGHMQLDHHLGSAFGGFGDIFLSQGCSTGAIYLWQKFNSKSVISIKAHAGPVNSIAFHPNQRATMVSASDDSTIRVWVSAQQLQHQQLQAQQLSQEHTKKSLGKTAQVVENQKQAESMNASSCMFGMSHTETTGLQQDDQLEEEETDLQPDQVNFDQSRDLSSAARLNRPSVGSARGQQHGSDQEGGAAAAANNQDNGEQYPQFIYQAQVNDDDDDDEEEEDDDGDDGEDEEDEEDIDDDDDDDDEDEEEVNQFDMEIDEDNYGLRAHAQIAIEDEEGDDGDEDEDDNEDEQDDDSAIHEEEEQNS